MRLRTWEPDLLSLTNRLRSGEIDLQPDFQRGDVWNISKKRRLIDTILRGWTIPPIHLTEQINGKTEVLDGQQRLSSIRDFYDGRFSINGHITPLDGRGLRLHDLFYGDLSPEDRRVFDNYVLRVVTIYDYDAEEPGELFYRLNEGVKLTPAEQRNALFGPVRDQIKSVIYQLDMRGVNRERIGFSNSRMAYEDVISRLIFAIERESIYTSFSETEISERFRSSAAIDDKVLSVVSDAINRFSFALDISLKTKFNKATLLSTLIYFSFVEPDTMSISSLEEFVLFSSNSLSRPFEKIQPELFKNDDPGHVLHWERSVFSLDTILQEIYRDRSSLRVNDASSVVSRDICLYLFSNSRSGVEPHTPLRRDIISYLRNTSHSQHRGGLVDALQNRQLLMDWGRLA